MNHIMESWSKQKDHKLIDLASMITEDDSVYHANRSKYLSSHALADFRHCPSIYYQKKTGIIADADSTAYMLGRGAHTRILEGHAKYLHSYAIGGPINEKTGKPYGEKTKAYAEWAAEQDKDVLSIDHDQLITDMADSVAGHNEAAHLLADGVAEKVARVRLHDVPCQIRCDWMHPRKGLVDLKTCENLDWFENDISRYGYMFQMAFYRAVLQEYFGVVVDVHIIAVEKRKPHRVGVWHLSSAPLDQAEKINRVAIHSLKRCQDDDYWPTGFEKIRDVDHL